MFYLYNRENSRLMEYMICLVYMLTIYRVFNLLEYLIVLNAN